jgi:DNA-binding MarR family transcriptional regulator
LRFGGGLVAGQFTAPHGGAIRVALTAAGRRLAETLREAHIANCTAMLGRLTPPEREEFLRLAGRIAAPEVTESPS